MNLHNSTHSCLCHNHKGFEISFVTQQIVAKEWFIAPAIVGKETPLL